MKIPSLLLCSALLLFTSGCHFMKLPARIQLSDTAASVVPPAEASAPTTVATNTKKTETVVPPQTEIKQTRTEIAATATTPAKVVTETVVKAPEAITTTVTEAIKEVSLAAPRAPDKSVELAKVASHERLPLLWLGIGLIVAGLVIAFVLKFPVIGGKVAILGGGGALAAWKIAAVPPWLWAVGLAMAGVAVAFYFRGKWDANGDGVPDILQKDAPLKLFPTVPPSTSPKT